MSSLYNVSTNLSRKYEETVNDVVKFSTVMLFYQLFGNLSSTGQWNISEESVNAILLVILGILFYHLVLRRIVSFQYIA